MTSLSNNTLNISFNCKCFVNLSTATRVKCIQVSSSQRAREQHVPPQIHGNPGAGLAALWCVQGLPNDQKSQTLENNLVTCTHENRRVGTFTENYSVPSRPAVFCSINHKSCNSTIKAVTSLRLGSAATQSC